MPATEVIDLCDSSSPEAERRSKDILVPSKPATVAAKSIAVSGMHDIDANYGSDQPDISELRKLRLAKLAGPTTSESVDVVAKPKVAAEVYFLENDFDSTVNLDDSLPDIRPPPPKKRRISPPRGSPSAKVKTTTKGSESSNGTKLKASAQDPITFTSSPDPYENLKRRREERRKQTGMLKDDDDDPFASSPIEKAKTGSKSFLSDLSEDSNEDLPDICDISDPSIWKIPSKKSTSWSKSNLHVDKAMSKFSSGRKPEPNAREKTEKDPDERAREKVEKARQREARAAEKRAEKEAEKAQKEIEKARKLREKEDAVVLARANTIGTDRKAFIQEMIVELPTSLQMALASQTRRFLDQDNSKIRYTEYETEHPIIRWKRKQTRVYDENEGQWIPVDPPTIQKEAHIMYVISAKYLVELATGDEDHDLDQHFRHIKTRFPSSKCIYLIEGLEAWRRSNLNLKNRMHAHAVRSHMDHAQPSGSQRSRKSKAQEYLDEEIVNDAVLRLQVLHNVLIHHTSTMVETAEWIRVFTEHISTIPYKLVSHSLDTNFCMETGQVKTGVNASDTYTKMLESILKITPPVACGIASEFPTVTALVRGLKENGPQALADLRKTANRTGSFSDRAIGPAISRRIYSIFTSRDDGSCDI